MEVSCQVEEPSAIFPKRYPLITIGRRLDGPHIWSARCLKKKIIARYSKLHCLSCPSSLHSKQIFCFYLFTEWSCKRHYVSFYRPTVDVQVCSFFDLDTRWAWVVNASPRKDPVSIHSTRSWVGCRAGLDECRKSRPPPGFDPLTVKPVASRYTDWAIPAPLCNLY